MFLGLEPKEHSILEKPRLVLEETTAGFEENHAWFLGKQRQVSYETRSHLI